MFKQRFDKYKISFVLAYFDIKARYSRTIIGPFWNSIMLFATIMAMGPLYGLMFKTEISNFTINLAIGLFVWQFFSKTIIESCLAFKECRNIYNVKNIGLTIPVVKVCVRNIIILGHHIIAVVAVFFIFDPGLIPKLFSLFITLPIIFLFTYSLSAWISILCLRFKDIESLITNLVTLLFFISPIIWSKELIQDTRIHYINLNPISSLLDCVKAPILDQQLFLYQIFYIFCLCIINFFILIIVKKKIKKKYLLWL